MVGIRYNDYLRYDFNSIKVRLEPPYCKLSITALVFQFHKGAIRTLMGMRTRSEGRISIP